MTWIDVVMWAGLALMVGFTTGFRWGKSLGGDGMDYHRGVRAGYQLAKDGETDG